MNTKIYYGTLKALLIFTLVFSGIISFAQLAGTSELKYGDFIKLQKGVPKNILTTREIAGSPYQNDNFLAGYVTINNTKYEDIPLRYNIFNDNIEFRIDCDAYLAISNPEAVKEVVIQDKKFIYTDKEGKVGKTKGYYEQIYDGNTQVLKRYNIVFYSSIPTNGYREAQPPKFVRFPETYYLKIGEKAPMQITKKKEFKTLYGENGEKIYDYINKENLKLHKEDDLIKIAQYIDQLNN